MVRQLGIPTWFFTVTAADMQLPDLIQTIARQYGKTLTDEDVKSLTFEQRSMWLRSHPVTAGKNGIDRGLLIYLPMRKKE